jgi:methyl-accepting chemotaxis protein
MIEGMSASSQEQSSNLTEISARIGEVARITRSASDGTREVFMAVEGQNSAMSQISRSSQELKVLADGLHQLVEKFRLEDGGIKQA